MHNLIITGPKGVAKRKISAGEYEIKWIPTIIDVNNHFPFCYFFEARDRYHRIYHSKVRCLIADVGRHDTVVRCTQTTMSVEVEKSYLIQRNENSLHLKNSGDPSCRLTSRSNRTHLIAIMPLTACGTTVEEDENNIIFKNEITSAHPNEVVTRQHDVEIAFSCVYPKRSNMTLGFSHKNPYAFLEKGFGAFTFQFEFYESERFITRKDPKTYPVEVNLKQMIFMEIKATTSIPKTVLFVESCKATPYDNPNSRTTYTIIDNGCVRDNTVKIYSDSKSQFRFGMEAFEFIGAHEHVYITCTVMLCKSGVAGTRCSQGCTRRSKREAAGQTARHLISQGPLQLRGNADGRVSGPSLTLGMNIMFIVGCLLVCGVVVYRSRRSKAKYQLLLNTDTD